MKVTLLNFSMHPDDTVAGAAKVCYSDKSIEEINGKIIDSPKDTRKFITKLVEMRHESPLEHVSFTFGIEGVSRALTHQLVRHRIASYSQKSQRYVSEKQFEYVTPHTISNNNIVDKYNDLMGQIQDVYNELVAAGVPKEDARYVLPNACETSIEVTMNARSLINFFSHRCCSRAQWEIREAANQMLAICKQVSPYLFNNIGASCITLGYCPEGKMSCGFKPTLETILDVYNKSLKNHKEDK